MKTYKATDNTQPSGFSLHAIEPEFAHLLPYGCVEITEAEAESLRPKPSTPTYADLRRAEYPPIGDQLDAIWKGGEAAAAMKVIIDGIKAKYPKG